MSTQAPGLPATTLHSRCLNVAFFGPGNGMTRDLLPCRVCGASVTATTMNRRSLVWTVEFSCRSCGHDLTLTSSVGDDMPGALRKAIVIWNGARAAAADLDAVCCLALHSKGDITMCPDFKNALTLQAKVRGVQS